MMGEAAAEKRAQDQIEAWLRNAPKDVLRDLAGDPDPDDDGDGVLVVLLASPYHGYRRPPLPPV